MKSRFELRLPRFDSRRAFACFSIAALLTVGIRPALACYPISAQSLDVESERALIVWDAKTHTEHFTRQATFVAEADDFGFLVPTPTVPELAEADAGIFPSLDEQMQPQKEVVTRRLPHLTSWFHPKPSYATVSNRHQIGTSVLLYTQDYDTYISVVKTQHIGAYTATILKASDTTALNHWLTRNGYPVNPSLLEWLEPYVARHWTITAFKVTKHEAGEVWTTLPAVRMSFHTEVPFYPYREPKKEPLSEKIEATSRATPGLTKSEARELRVYFYGDRRVTGLREDNGQAWNGKTEFAAPLDERVVSFAATALRLEPDSLPEKGWLTEMRDTSSPRPGTADLLFLPDPNAQTLRPTPTPIYETVPLDIPVEPLLGGSVFLLGTGIFFVRKRLERSRSNPNKN